MTKCGQHLKWTLELDWCPQTDQELMTLTVLMAITHHTAESPFVKINQIHEAVQQCDNAAESPHLNSLFALLLLSHVSVVLGILPKG